MSPRAACRLETLGFEHVYDYMPGKVDWLARGLPREGSNASLPRVVDVARHDVVTCRLSDPVATVAALIAASPYDFALVLGDSDVLLGRLRKSALQADSSARAEQAMESGPSTVRAHIAPQQVAERLARQRLDTAVVTDPDGRLLGVVRRDDLERASSVADS
jgi:CBS domain-containing protein